jgi:hypothetical protein
LLDSSSGWAWMAINRSSVTSPSNLLELFAAPCVLLKHLKRAL